MPERTERPATPPSPGADEAAARGDARFDIMRVRVRRAARRRPRGIRALLRRPARPRGHARRRASAVPARAGRSGSTTRSSCAGPTAPAVERLGVPRRAPTRTSTLLAGRVRERAAGSVGEAICAGCGRSLRVLGPVRLSAGVLRDDGAAWRPSCSASTCIAARRSCASTTSTSHPAAWRQAFAFWRELGFRCSEYISTDGSRRALTGAWLLRKPAVHDVALTAGKGPRLHHFAFWVAEPAGVLRACDQLAAAEQSHVIERGPGRHGVSNAFFVYLRDPDGHRIELYSCDYYTGDPQHEPLRWSVTTSWPCSQTPVEKPSQVCSEKSDGCGRPSIQTTRSARPKPPAIVYATSSCVTGSRIFRMRSAGPGPRIRYWTGCACACRSGCERMLASQASAFCRSASFSGRPV